MNRRLIAALFAVVAAVLFGCAKKEPPTIKLDEIQNRRGGDPVVRVACVGDSITWGAGVEGRETNSYPARLQKLLGSRFDVRNFGRSGATASRTGDLPYWTTEELKQADEFQPDVVLIKLGTNDTKPQNWKGKDAYKKDLEGLIEHFKDLKTKPMIWVCQPVPVYGDQWGINAQTLDAVLEGVEEACDDKKVPVIDLFDALSNHADMFPDKIHPNAKGAALMANTIFQAIRP